MNSQEIDDLIEAFIEGTISNNGMEALNDQIKADPEIGIKLARAAKNDLYLKQALSSPKFSDSKILKLSNKRRKSKRKLSRKVSSSGWGWPTIMSLASCLIIGLGLVWLSQLNKEKTSVEPKPNKVTEHSAIEGSLGIEIIAMEGEVSLTRNGQAQPLKLGEHLAQHDILECHADSRLKFKLLNEKTIYHLDPNSKITLDDEKGKTWSLEKGLVGAQVSKQKKGERIIFKTVDAEIEVLGTILQVLAGYNESTLRVLEGKVNMVRKSDQRSILVRQGHYASTSFKDFKPTEIGVADDESFEVVALTLIDAIAQKPFDGYVHKMDLGEIDSSQLPSNKFNIEIHTLPKFIGSMQLTFEGPNGFKKNLSENYYPYTLRNQNKSLSLHDPPNYEEYDLLPGEYIIRARPFSKMFQTGREGEEKVFRFTVK